MLFGLRLSLIFFFKRMKAQRNCDQPLVEQNLEIFKKKFSEKIVDLRDGYCVTAGHQVGYLLILQ